jgi:hypothetical protein
VEARFRVEITRLLLAFVWLADVQEAETISIAGGNPYRGRPKASPTFEYPNPGLPHLFISKNIHKYLK